MTLGLGPGFAAASEQRPAHVEEVTLDPSSGERSSCTHGATPPASTPDIAAAGLANQTITVAVPATVRVEAASASDLRIITNAGRPPAPGDHVHVRQPDGTYAPAAPAVVERVLSAQWGPSSWCDTTEVHVASR